MSPILIGEMNTRLGRPVVEPLRILVDTGTTSSIILGKFTKKLRMKRTTATTWRTKAGTFTTTKKCKIQFRLPELHRQRIIEYTVNVDDSKESPNGYYDLLLGTDMCQELGIIIDYKESVVKWDDATTPLVDRDTFRTNENLYEYLYEQAAESEAAQAATSRMTRILDNDYHKADLEAIVKKCIHLSTDEQKQLLRVLRKHEPLFDGTLGKWNVEPFDLQLKPGVTPYHARAFPIPRVYHGMRKRYVKRYYA